MSYSKLNVACVVDRNYLVYATGLYLSAKATLGNFTFHLNTVNTVDTTWFEQQKDVCVYPTTVDLPTLAPVDRGEYDNEFLLHFDKSESPKITPLAAYCNNIRFEFASRLLANGVDNLLLLDADMLFNRDVSHLKFSVKEHLALQSYIDNGATRYCVEFLFIKNKPETVRLFNDLATQVHTKQGIYKWGHAKFFAEMVDSATYISKLLVSDFYRDSLYRSFSYIWTGEDYRKQQRLCDQLHQTGYLDKLKLLLRDAGLSSLYPNK